MLVYFITFGDTFASLIQQWFYSAGKTGFFASRLCWVMVISAVLTPLIIKKDLKELKIVSAILFISLGLFILIFFVDLCDGHTVNPDPNFGYYWKTQWDAQLVTSFSIVLVAYSCQ